MLGCRDRKEGRHHNTARFLRYKCRIGPRANKTTGKKAMSRNDSYDSHFTEAHKGSRLLSVTFDEGIVTLSLVILVKTIDRDGFGNVTF